MAHDQGKERQCSIRKEEKNRPCSRLRLSPASDGCLPGERVQCWPPPPSPQRTNSQQPSRLPRSADPPYSFQLPNLPMHVLSFLFTFSLWDRSRCTRWCFIVDVRCPSSLDNASFHPLHMHNVRFFFSSTHMSHFIP